MPPTTKNLRSVRSVISGTHLLTEDDGVAYVVERPSGQQLVIMELLLNNEYKIFFSHLFLKNGHKIVDDNGGSKTILEVSSKKDYGFVSPFRD